jgi:transcriptional regulator with XRE-family HTH domain
MYSTIGTRISRRLKERNMSQKQLADATGITSAAVSRYVNGTREPRARTLLLIANALETTPNSLTGVTGDELTEACEFIIDNASDISEELRMRVIRALAYAQDADPKHQPKT